MYACSVERLGGCIRCTLSQLKSSAFQEHQEQDAMSALQRIKNGQPAGLGLLGLKIATDAATKAGGQLSVHALKQGTGVCIKFPLEH